MEQSSSAPKWRMQRRRSHRWVLTAASVSHLDLRFVCGVLLCSTSVLLDSWMWFTSFFSVMLNKQTVKPSQGCRAVHRQCPVYMATLLTFLLLHINSLFFCFQKSDTESVTSSEPPILTRSTSQDSEASTVVGHGQLRYNALCSHLFQPHTTSQHEL